MPNKPIDPSSLPIQTLGSKVVFTCRWYSVRQDAVIFPDGTAGEYNVVQVIPCVFVVPVTPSGEVVLIHHYRHTLQRWVWEVPAGGVEHDTPGDAATAELREEVGGVASSIDYLGEYFPSNGFTNEVAHLYVAWDVEMGAQQLESAESISVHPTSLEDTLHMIRTNRLKDAPSALAILLAETQIRQRCGC